MSNLDFLLNTDGAPPRHRVFLPPSFTGDNVNTSFSPRSRSDGALGLSQPNFELPQAASPLHLHSQMDSIPSVQHSDFPANPFASVSPENSPHRHLSNPYMPPSPSIPTPELPDTSLAVTANFVDRLATRSSLTPEQRNDFQFFAKAIGHMPLSHQPGLLMMQATILRAFNKIQDYDTLMSQMAETIAALAAKLDTKFDLSTETKDNIHAIAKEAIIEEKRSCFTTLHLDVDTRCKLDAVALKYPQDLSPANLKKLDSQVRRTCSTVRNQLRRDIATSIKGVRTRRPLSVFTNQIVQKYNRPNSARHSGSALERLQIQLAIYRKIARENMAIAEDDMDDQTPPSEEPAPKKRKRNNGTGTAKDIDFWALVEAFFKKRLTQWGDDLRSPEWDAEIRAILAEDEEHVPSQRGSKTPRPVAPQVPTGIFAGLEPFGAPATPTPAGREFGLSGVARMQGTTTPHASIQNLPTASGSSSRSGSQYYYRQASHTPTLANGIPSHTEVRSQSRHF